jgi:tetratricopeptide (TPR) repeat protein
MKSVYKQIAVFIMISFSFSFPVNAEMSTGSIAQAEGFKNAGQFFRANRVYFMALRKDANDTSAHYGLADSYYRNQQIDKALESINKLLAINSLNVEALLLQGQLFLTKQMWQQALNAFQLVRDVGPSKAEIYLGLREAYTGLDDKGSAKQMQVIYDSLVTAGR